MLAQIKSALISTGYFQDTVPCHLASGLGAGFFAVCIGSPVDVVKSRLMGKFTEDQQCSSKIVIRHADSILPGHVPFVLAEAACNMKCLHKLPGLD